MLAVAMPGTFTISHNYVRKGLSGFLEAFFCCETLDRFHNDILVALKSLLYDAFNAHFV